VRLLAALIGGAWGFRLLHANPVYFVIPMFAVLLYFSFEEILLARRKVNHDVPSPKSN